MIEHHYVFDADDTPSPDGLGILYVGHARLLLGRHPKGGGQSSYETIAFVGSYEEARRLADTFNASEISQAIAEIFRRAVGHARFLGREE